MQKELVLQFPKRKISLTLFNQKSCTHNHSKVITMPPFSWVPSFPYLLLPSWELQGGDQSPLLLVGGRTWLALAPGPYLILWPLLVSWSAAPMSPVRAWPSGQSNTGPKENLEYFQEVCLLVPFGVPLLQPGQTSSPVAQVDIVVGILPRPPAMMQKSVLRKPSITLGEVENSGLLHRWAQRS